MVRKKDLRDEVDYWRDRVNDLQSALLRNETRRLDLEYRWLYGVPALDSDRTSYRLRRRLHDMMQQDVPAQTEAVLLYGTADVDELERMDRAGEIIGGGGSYVI